MTASPGTFVASLGSLQLRMCCFFSDLHVSQLRCRNQRAAAAVALALALPLIASVAAAGSSPPSTADWPYTEGAAGAGRFSPLTDVTKENVDRLEVAWTYEHDDHWRGSVPLEVNRGSAVESTYSRAACIAVTNWSSIW